MVSEKTYAILCALFIALFFIFFGKHTSFEWTTVQDFPTILRLYDSNFLTNDFYTNSVMGSPRLIYAYLIKMVSDLFQIHWYTTTYVLKLMCLVLMPSLLYIYMYKTIALLLKKQILDHYHETLKAILFLGCVGIFALIQGKGSGTAPFGWGAIQVNYFLSPMTLSFVLGLIYLISLQSHQKIKHLAPFFLLLSTAIHPAIGLCNITLAIMFFYLTHLKRNDLFFFIRDLAIGITIPIIFIMLQFKGSSGINPSVLNSEFIKAYVHLRHPHHYLMSKIVGLSAVIWTLTFIALLTLSIRIKNSTLIRLAGLSLAALIIAPLLQYIAAELIHNKSIVIIGPSRFSAYASIMLGICVLSIIPSYWYDTVVNKKQQLSTSKINPNVCYKKSLLCIKKIIIKAQNIFKNRSMALILLLCILFMGLFKSTLQHPVDYYKHKDARLLINWFKNNTPKNSLVFSLNFDPFLLRIYAKRAVFADKAFPFNETYVNEFSKRYQLLLNSASFKAKDYACIAKHYPLNFIILNKNKTIDFPNKALVFQSSQWNVFDLTQLSIQKHSCNINKLYKTNA